MIYDQIYVEYLRGKYSSAQTFFLHTHLTRAAEALGRLKADEDLKREDDFTTFVQSIAVAKQGYKEMQEFGLEDKEIARKLRFLESDLLNLTSPTTRA